jgi:hypothetical protein
VRPRQGPGTKRKEPGRARLLRPSNPSVSTGSRPADSGLVSRPWRYRG